MAKEYQNNAVREEDINHNFNNRLRNVRSRYLCAMGGALVNALALTGYASYRLSETSNSAFADVGLAAGVFCAITFGLLGLVGPIHTISIDNARRRAIEGIKANET